jgi:hypothetical protein
MMLAVRRLLIGATLIYCLGVVILMILWTTYIRQAWWVALSNVFALYLFAPLLLFVPAALLVRSRWLRGAVLLSLAVFLALFGARLIPPPARQEGGTTLRVMTLNQLYSNRRVDDIIAAIQAQDADVVALQELSAPVAAAAQQRLGTEYPYQLLAPAEGDYGLGFLSRYPLLAPVRQQEFVGQQVTLSVGGQQISLINVHLPAPSIKMRQFRPLRPLTARRPGALDLPFPTISASVRSSFHFRSCESIMCGARAESFRRRRGWSATAAGRITVCWSRTCVSEPAKNDRGSRMEDRGSLPCHPPSSIFDPRSSAVP